MRYSIGTAGISLIALLITFSACVPADEVAEDQTTPDQDMESITQAVAVLHPTEGNETRGVVHFVRSDHGVRIVADVEGLNSGAHGFHIHQLGDCSAPDGTSAGGHFNPEGKAHGGPDDVQRHVGDLGNLMADDSGAAHYEATDSILAFSGSHSIIGRGVIVHAGEDDLTSQPTGAAGARLACGVIGIDEG